MNNNNIFIESLNYYKDKVKINSRYEQLEELVKILTEHFKFFKINCVETGASQNFDDGCVGLFFAELCNKSSGYFYSVDNNPHIVDKSKKLYEDHNLNFVKHYTDNSVNFLQNINDAPNLIHLDSWDLDLKNPFPSALHGWREFISIENKMSVGSIIVIDDNFFKGSWVMWDYSDNSSERININYPIIGKGSMVYHFVETGESNWVKISTDIIGINNKIVFKKIKQ